MQPDQIPFGLTEFAENPEPRCPCLLLLDTSTSMRGRPMSELNDGLQSFRSSLNVEAVATPGHRPSVLLRRSLTGKRLSTRSCNPSTSELETSITDALR